MLRERIRPMRVKSTLWALTIVAIDLAFYLASLRMALTHLNFAVATLFGALAGVGIGTLFLVGHDACHGSFTASRTLNSWLGRLAFLPSLTPFSTWELGHNQTHHQYTNLKTKDYVWAPFSKPEYDRLPPWRRMVERVYRSVFGVGLYYAIEIWWRRLMFPAARSKKRYLADSALCAAAGLALLLGVGLRLGWKPLVTGVFVPFVCWTWLMGWAVFQHHTHPEVPWFDDETEWRDARAHWQCTVHAILPKPLDVLFHHIMHHTAHHLDVTIPLYRLPAAQSSLESAPGARVIAYQWTPFSFLRHLRHCRLYDFRNKRWLDFDGTPARSL